MTVTETLAALGAWSLNLVDDTPRAVTDQLGFFGHVGIWRGRVDVEQTSDATLLTSARYVGVLREKPTGRTSLEGSGMVLWLGDEDGKGAVLESPVVFSSASLPTCVTTLLPPAVTVGTIHDPGGTYTGKHQWQTPRDVLDTICTAFGVEYRVNPNGTVDVGTAAQLYGTTPKTIISARGAGRDFDLTSLGADFSTDTSVVDYSSRLVLIGQKTNDAGDSTPFVEAAADATSFPYKDMHGNAVRITRTVSDSGQTDASAPAAAQLHLNLYNRTKTALKITAADYEISGQAVVGQNAYVFDPDNGLYDPETQVDFRGELIFPMVIRITALTWPVTEGHTVAFRTGDGVWVDLTRWVAWESGSEDITVGDLPKTLTTSSNPVLDQTQSAPDASTPNAPTGLVLTTTSVESTAGQSTAIISASWTAPTQNTDGSVLTDLSYYLVQYRWRNRAPQWSSLPSPTTTVEIPNLVVGLIYDVQVTAVDTTGHFSVPTPIESITAAPDQTAPNPPSDPVVTSYLGQLRVAWDGKDNTGAAMPPDFSIVEVHVSATSGFTPDSSPGSATLVSELSTAGVAYATAPYGATRYVKLVAVDNSGNRSSPSGQASAATTQVVSADIFDGAVGTEKLADLAVTTAKINDLAVNDAKIGSLSVGKLTGGTGTFDLVVAGQITTALTGGRTVFSALGFQKFAADGVTKLIDFTGASNLLTGTLQTALSGRRIVSGASGNSGSIQLIAPDGTTSILTSTALSGGAEGVSLSLPISGTNAFWNTLRIDSTELAFLDAKATHFAFGGTPGGDGDFRVSFATSKGNATTPPALSDRLVILESSSAFYDSTGLAHMNIAGSFTEFWYESGGTFQITEWNSSSSQDRLRLSIGNNGNWLLYKGKGSGFNIVETVPGSETLYSRFNIADSDVSFTWGSTNARVVIQPKPTSDDGQTSALVQLVNNNNFGSVLAFRAGADGSVQRLGVRDAINASYIAVWATAFSVQSSAASKTAIADLAFDPMEKLRARPVKSWRRKGPQDADGKHAPEGRTEYGWLAEEAPEEVVVRDHDGSLFGVDLGSQVGLLIAAVQSLDGRLTIQEGKR